MSELTYVYPNQIKAWEDTQLIMADRQQNRITCNAQPQVGKTSFMIHAMIERAKKAKALGSDYFNVIAIADANNALRKQTDEAIDRALKEVGLSGERHKFHVEHRAALDDFSLPSDETFHLSAFIDETHIAARIDGARDRFQRRIYNYKGNRLYMDVGATSFAHMALYANEDAPYDGMVQLDPGPAYNSVKLMYDRGRIRQVEKLCTRDGEPTEHLIRHLDVLKRHGGYTVIRATGKRHAALVWAIRKLNPTLRIVEADMQSASAYGHEHIPIVQIPEFLATQPKEPTILLLRGALRVGIVLRPACSNYICEMIDTNPARGDTATQSFVGRCCGYHKKNDTHPIYTNMKWVETVIDCYDDIAGAIPLGLKNTGSHRTGSYQVVPADEAQRLIADHAVQVSRCSENNVNDVADHVLRNINTWADRLVLIDKPNGNFGASFKILAARRPQFIGEYVRFFSDRAWYTQAKVNENFIDLAYLRNQDDEDDEIDGDDE